MVLEISILFSLFQSPYKASIKLFLNVVFPYYLVYFKASASYFRIPDFFIFPYYLVYFKALKWRIKDENDSSNFHTI